MTDMRMYKLIKNSPENLKILNLSIMVLLFTSFLFFFLLVPLWDYDFWWHIATGRYIVTEGLIPHQDIFSFTSNLAENKNHFPERENLILKQYWVAQSLFYAVFNNYGPEGIIFLRAILLVLTLLIVYRRFQESGVSFIVSFISIFLLFNISIRSTGERPVLFSILFTALTLFILENFKDKRSRNIFFLVPVMLLWSNMHGGFILGDVILMVFMLCEGLKMIVKKSSYNRHELLLFFSATGVAIVASFMNPNGWNAFLVVFSPKYEVFVRGIQESESPFHFYFNKLRPVDYNHIFVVLLFPLILLLRNKKLDLNHVILLSGFWYMSILSSRYIIFYAIIGIMIMAKETDILFTSLIKKRLSEKFYKKVQYGLIIATLCSTLIFMVAQLKKGKFEFKTATEVSVPESAVNFIQENRIEGNIFNEYAYGGYIEWKLYPWKKTFIDSRKLNYTVASEYSWVTNAVNSVTNANLTPGKIPLWERLLDHYEVNIVFLSPLSVEGYIPPLLFGLLESDKWVPVYIDSLSFIFVRNMEQNKDIIRQFKISDDVIYNKIILRTVELAALRNNAEYFISLGNVFIRTGRLKDALTAYEYAIDRMPRWHPERKRFEEMKKKLDQDAKI